MASAKAVAMQTGLRSEKFSEGNFYFPITAADCDMLCFKLSELSTTLGFGCKKAIGAEALILDFETYAEN